MEQHGDVLLQQTVDDGDLAVADGIVEMTGDLRTAVYISLFGGQADWWGDIGVTNVDFHNTSETDELLENMAAVPANLLLLRDAIHRDLEWLINQKIASSITVETSMPGIDIVAIVITIIAWGKEEQFEFVENWKAFA